MRILVIFIHFPLSKQSGCCVGHSQSLNVYLPTQYATNCHGKINIKRRNSGRETEKRGTFSKVRLWSRYQSRTTLSELK
jgi:hypothetical protein